MSEVALDGPLAIERIKLFGQLAAQVSALGEATGPLARIQAGRVMADLMRMLSATAAVPVADAGTRERVPNAEQYGITKEESTRLFASLKRLNSDPGWSGGDGYRYEIFAKRIDAATDGVATAVAWAREWLAGLNAEEAEERQREEENIAFQKEVADRLAADLAAGHSSNPLYQAWLDTLTEPATAKNHDYMAWNSARGAEFDKLWKGARRDISGKFSAEYHMARAAYFRQWADEHLSGRVKAQRAVAQDPEGELIIEPGDEVNAADVEAPVDPESPAQELVEHVTGRGKTLRGVIRTDLTYAQAKEIDPYTFRKNDGFFIRDKHLDGGTAGIVEPGVKLELIAEQQARAEADRLANEQLRQQKKRAEQASKLRGAGQSAIDKAESELGRDRNTNTARRAAIASNIERRNEQARANGKTMLNLADAIELGEVKALAGVSSRAVVEILHNLLVNAMGSRDSKRWNYAQQQENQGRKPEPEDVQFARYPRALWNGAGASPLRILELLKGKRGSKELAERIRYRAEAAPEDIALLRNMIGDKEADDQLGWWNIEQAKRETSLRRAGISNFEQLHAALLEYMQFREGTRLEDPIKKAERAILGQKVGLDFFPTPAGEAQRMVQMAGIKAGDRVLEPSAGNGNIADAAAAAGAKVDVLEISSQLREILKVKGYNVVGHDFLEYEPDEKYDAVLMNPPFSNRLDATHIMRAYDMVKPGGKLVAIAGEGVFFGADRKAVEFRDWLERHSALVEQLQQRTFQDRALLATTGANARLLVIEK